MRNKLYKKKTYATSNLRTFTEADLGAYNTYDRDISWMLEWS